ncbi:MAG TPA: DUF4331 family protein [Dehalococcoidia bacterium]|nr:DUF4331 family protein [Dehalococcoidia bacterium]
MPTLNHLRGASSALLIAGVLFAVAAAALWALNPASGADHRDSPAAEANAALDITDVYAFRSPANNDNLVVGFGVNGLTAPTSNDSARFNASATYTLHVDVDGDLADDATVNVDFDDATPQNFTITGLGDAITGAVTPAGQSANVVSAGGISAFAGLRDDPFFFDLTGFKSFVAGPYVPAAGLRADGAGAPADAFAGTNTSYVVLELPITAVTGEVASNTGTIKAWVSTSNGGSQLDRMAIPAINTALIPSDMKDGFNQGSPATDVAEFQATAQASIEGLRAAVNGVLDSPVGEEDGGPLGDLTPEQVAGALIPDIVTIDFSQDVVFPNGRQLTDDVIDVALQLVLNRTAGITDDIDANDKSFSSSFPYLAEPFVAASGPTPAGVPTTGGQPLDDGNGISTALVLAVAGGALIVLGGGLTFGRKLTG